MFGYLLCVYTYIYIYIYIHRCPPPSALTCPSSPSDTRRAPSEMFGRT